MASAVDAIPTDAAGNNGGGRTTPRMFRRVLTGSMAGAVLEWYDFAIYGVLAAMVLGPLFFPSDSGIASLLMALATQGLGFFARPLGGIVFGHLGDRFGRKPMLVVTVLLLGTATAAIGLLPTHADIGITATFLLVGLRLMLGFALAGEFGAAVLMASEYGEPKRRGCWASWPQAGAPAGTVLATAVITVLTLTMSEATFESWGWRIAFLIAIPLLAIGFWVRRGVEESPVFRQAQAQAAKTSKNTSTEKQKSSIVLALRRPRQVLHGLGQRLGENIAFYIYTTFVIAYATTYFEFDRGDVMLAVTFGSVFQFLGMIS